MQQINTILFGVAVACLLCICSARPRYVLVPLEDYEAERPVYVRTRRSPRLVEILEPAASEIRPIEEKPILLSPPRIPEQILAESRPERQAGGYGGQSGGYGGGGDDYVDYGAYTAKGGAFGWYTDHPVDISSYNRGGYS